MAELNLSGVEVLQSEIEKSKDKLRSYNENIKKLTGRDPNRPGVKRMLSGEGVEREEDGYSGRIARGRGRLFGLARRGIMEDSGPPTKRRVIGGGAFTRLGPAPVPARRRAREDSPYEEEPPTKLSVQSSVVSTSRETKSRKEIMQEQTKDKDGMQRNRRMFGLLLGTLNKFKTESKTLETKEVQRKKIEEKLEEIAEKEKKKFKLETKLLMEEMHIEQSKISRLEQKMEMVQEHADRAKEMEKLKNFIATKAKPRIFWKPVHNSSMIENKLKESKKVVDEMLQEGKDRLEKEIKELMEREYKREERIKMRLREDGLFGDEDEAVIDDQGNKESNEVVVVVGANREPVTVGGVNRDIKQELESSFNMADVEGSQSPPSRDQLKSKSRRTVVLESEKEDKSEADSDIDNTEGVRESKRTDLDAVNRKKQNKKKEEESSSEEEDNAKVERRESEGREAKRSVELQISDRSRESQRLKKTDTPDVERERGEKQDISRSEKQRLKESDESDDGSEKGKVQNARKRGRHVSKESDDSDDERERKKRQNVRRTEKQRSKESDDSDDDRERGKKQDGRRERKREVIAEKESDKKENESHRKDLTSKGGKDKSKHDSRHVRKDKDRRVGHTNSKHHQRDSRDSHDSDSSSDSDSDSKKDRKREKGGGDKRSKDHSRRSRERAVSGKNSKNITSSKNDSDSDNSKH